MCVFNGSMIIDYYIHLFYTVKIHLCKIFSLQTMLFVCQFSSNCCISKKKIPSKWTCAIQTYFLCEPTVLSQYKYILECIWKLYKDEVIRRVTLSMVRDLRNPVGDSQSQNHFYNDRMFYTHNLSCYRTKIFSVKT